MKTCLDIATGELSRLWKTNIWTVCIALEIYVCMHIPCLVDACTSMHTLCTTCRVMSSSRCTKNMNTITLEQKGCLSILVNIQICVNWWYHFYKQPGEKNCFCFFLPNPVILLMKIQTKKTAAPLHANNVILQVKTSNKSSPYQQRQVQWKFHFQFLFNIMSLILSSNLKWKG